MESKDKKKNIMAGGNWDIPSRKDYNGFGYNGVNVFYYDVKHASILKKLTNKLLEVIK